MIRAALVLIATSLFLEGASPGADQGIREALAKQSAAWNRGDLNEFVSTYASDCTFIGKQVVEGREKVLARYRATYPSMEKMGKLDFRLLAVRDIQPGISAYAIGEFHLQRSQAGGGDASGIFSLIFCQIDGRWLIVLDHTS